MKKNLPISGIEKTYPIDLNILSTTDLKGSVTYVNRDFCDLAEFSPDELLHKNHNTVRHPEMPQAAFENLWETIKSGKAWLGPVKNRCKSGNHYWVDAYVTPIKDGEKIVEFQSVRFTPDREHVKRAEQAYASISEGKVPDALKRPSVPFWLTLVLGAVLGIMPMFGYMLWQGGGLNAVIALMVSIAVTTGIISMLVKRRLKSLSDWAHTVVDNPLMKSIYTGSRDEVAQIELAVKMARSELRGIVGRIKDSSEQIGSVAGETNKLIKKTTDGAHGQQAEIHQLASAIEEMSCSFQEVAQNCETSSNEAERAQKLSIESQSVAKKAITANESLTRELGKTTEIITDLAQRSENIGSVLDVIKSIAEQTNLLALNAAIEAARAGEQGRGFAVVADEVRTLAQRTQSSTEEIEEMIGLLQSGTKKAVAAMNSSRETATESVESITQTTDSLKRISDAVHSIADMSIQIASAAEEQSCVAAEISKNISNISNQADDAVHNTERAMDLAKVFDDQAKRQQKLVVQFLRY
ncbi:MAG: methyl-accepting chemotaxis protein [Hahellaceae bacterium]|nr:methyl-accepting chemotaxis protein [Hahellaceae bacterium]MCP5209730.1 methyl-accepting chemotaxis protein [Hahellaceae bacterium]